MMVLKGLRWALPFCFACTIESFSISAPPPTLIFLSPAVVAPGQRLIVVGQNFELTPEDPNDLPGSARPTPYSIEVFVGEQLIPFQPGDFISSNFLVITLPNLAPDRYSLRVEVQGQSTDPLSFFVDTITSLEFSQDPIILSTVGESVPLTVFGNRFDGTQVDVTNDVTFEVAPAGFVSIGFTHFMAGLRHGDAVLTARRGFLSDSITIRVEGDDQLLSISSPENITLQVGESAIIPLDGLTELGETVSLEAVSNIVISGDEAAIPLSRNELGQPVVSALAPGEITLTLTLDDPLFGETQTTVSVP
jgi:hypothetical protein